MGTGGKMKVIIMRGIPGSGKSTFIKNNYPEAAICSADNYFIDEGGNYNFDKDKIGEAHKECMATFLTYVMNAEFFDKDRVLKGPLIVDNTNISLHEVTPYLRVAEVFGCEVEVVRIECDVEVAYNRNKHDVPKRTINRMFNNLKPLPSWMGKEIVIQNEQGENNE